MKAYKGFNKDMTCRGFQFAEGKTYHEDKAELCQSGFHACENPLDCLKYYDPAHSVYYEVELDDVSTQTEDDTKRCGKTIKIGAKLDVLGLCKAHFEYTKSKTTTSEQGVDNANISAQNCSSVSAQDYSSVSARDYSSVSVRSYSSVSARNNSSVSAQNYSSVSAQSFSSVSARNNSSVSARNNSSVSAQNCSSVSAQSFSSVSARNYSSVSAQSYSSVSAQNYSSVSAQNNSSVSAQNESSLSAGKNSVIAAFNSKAKGGLNTLIALANRKWIGNEYTITDFKAAIIDGKTLMPGTWYKLENGEFVEVSDDEQ